MNHNELILIETILREASKYSQAAEHLAQLGRDAIKDPKKVKAVVAYMQKVKVSKDDILEFLEIFKAHRPVEIVAIIRDIACNYLGVRPSTTGSGQEDECKPKRKRGKFAQGKAKIGNLFRRNKSESVIMTVGDIRKLIREELSYQTYYHGTTKI